MSVPKKISEARIRTLFNDADYVGKAERGEIGCHVKSQSHPTSPVAPVPYCTKSQLVEYYDRDGRFLTKKIPGRDAIKRASDELVASDSQPCAMTDQDLARGPPGSRNLPMELELRSLFI